MLRAILDRFRLRIAHLDLDRAVRGRLPSQVDLIYLAALYSCRRSFAGESSSRMHPLLVIIFFASREEGRSGIVHWKA